ncbi:hypothetical protein AAZX31_17G137600 [Glycine max]
MITKEYLNRLLEFLNSSNKFISIQGELIDRRQIEMLCGT